MDDIPADLVVVGRLTTVYGVKGWVKLHSYTEPMENILGYRQWYLQRGKDWQAIEPEEVKRHQKGLIALLRGVEDREIARTYCQSDIAVSAAEMPTLEEGDFYWHQLQGLEVYTTGPDATEIKLGKVHQMMETGANDVMVVRACQGSIDNRERLIPWIPGQVLKQVDPGAGRITVDWDSEF